MRAEGANLSEDIGQQPYKSSNKRIDAEFIKSVLLYGLFFCPQDAAWKALGLWGGP